MLFIPNPCLPVSGLCDTGSMQGEAAGAQAFSNFDTFLAPYVRYDNLDYAQVKQCLQEFLFNLNVPTRVGFQTPFTNITMDLVVPDFLKNERVVHAGRVLEDAVYGDFQPEMMLLNKAFAEVMYEGDAAGSLSCCCPFFQCPFFCFLCYPAVPTTDSGAFC